MINPTAGVAKGCLNILFFQVGHLFQNLLMRKPSRQQVQHINDADSHPPNTGSSSALIWINRDPFFPIHGSATLVDMRFVNQRTNTGNASGAQWRRPHSLQLCIVRRVVGRRCTLTHSCTQRCKIRQSYTRSAVQYRRDDDGAGPKGGGPPPPTGTRHGPGPCGRQERPSSTSDL